MNIHECRFKYGKIYEIVNMLNLFFIATIDINDVSYLIVRDENSYNIQFELDTSYSVEKFKKHFSFYDEQKVRDRKIKKVMKLIN